MSPVPPFIHIVGARWAQSVNVLELACDRCGVRFDHRADRWIVRCPGGGRQEHLGALRDVYVATGGV